MLHMQQSVVGLKERNNSNKTLGFPTFKLPASTENRLLITRLNIIFDDFGI